MQKGTPAPRSARLTWTLALPTIAPPMRLHPESLSRGVPALVLLCTRPRLASAKSRRGPSVEARAAFELAQVLIDCALEDARAWTGPVVLALAQPNDLSWAGSLAERDWSIVGQAGGNAGERINAVDQILRRHGARSLVFVGPTAALDATADYALVRESLASADIALAPSNSGDIALMAARRPWPDLATLAWNTKRLSAELAYLCEREGLTVAKLERRPAIEGSDDLDLAVSSFRDDPRPKRRALVALARRLIEARAEPK